MELKDYQRKPNFEHFSAYCKSHGIHGEVYIRYLWRNLEETGWRVDFGKGHFFKNWHLLLATWNKVCKDKFNEEKELKREKRKKWFKEHTKNSFHVWTDGSAVKRADVKDKFVGGAAYVIVFRDKIYKQGNYGDIDTTISRMELLAIICGVGHCPLGSDVVVHSDSRYALNVLSGRYSAHKNLDLIELFKKHSSHVAKIRFKWVKGHSGEKYNELCDHLANEGRIGIMRKNKI